MILRSDPLADAAVILGLWMVGVTLIPTKLTIYGVQTVLLGALAAIMGVRHHEAALLWAGFAIIAFKGLAVPLYLSYVGRRIDCRRDDGLLIGPPLLLFLTVGALAALVLFHPLDDVFTPSNLPAAAIILIGMVLMISRRLALSQIVGFLVIENGMFLFTISQPKAMPLVVELGVLMDALAATMLAGLLVFRIRDSFEHIDVSEMKHLKG